MIKIQTSDGMTSSFSLEDPAHAKELVKRLGSESFQASITSMIVDHHGVQYALTRPSDFRRIFFNADVVPSDLERRVKGAQRVMCISDDVGVTLTVHEEQRAVRVSVKKTGKQRYNPLSNNS